MEKTPEGIEVVSYSQFEMDSRIEREVSSVRRECDAQRFELQSQIRDYKDQCSAKDGIIKSLSTALSNLSEGKGR